jgi:hypothetical protein
MEEVKAYADGSIAVTSIQDIVLAMNNMSPEDLAKAVQIQTLMSELIFDALQRRLSPPIPPPPVPEPNPAPDPGPTQP